MKVLIIVLIFFFQVVMSAQATVDFSLIEKEALNLHRWAKQWSVAVHLGNRRARREVLRRPEKQRLLALTQELHQLTAQLKQEWQLTSELSAGVSNGELLTYFEHRFTQLFTAITAFSQQHAHTEDLDLFVYEMRLLLKDFFKESLAQEVSLGENEGNDPRWREKTLTLDTALEVCHLVASPGDIILRKAWLNEGESREDFSEFTQFWISLVERLKGADPLLDYRHAEVIMSIPSPTNVVGISYYPWHFNKDVPLYLVIDESFNENYDGENFNYSLYRDDMSILRVKGLTQAAEVKKKEQALKRIEQRELYHPSDRSLCESPPQSDTDEQKFQQACHYGVCSDFVNWVYQDSLTSNWNAIPGLKQIMQILWPAVGVQTPDDLLDSYMTELVCDVDETKLKYPRKVYLPRFIQRLKTEAQSKNVEVSGHADRVLLLLHQEGILSENYDPLFDVLRFKIFDPSQW